MVFKKIIDHPIGPKRRSTMENIVSFCIDFVNVAGDTNRLRELEQSVRQYLAWSTICGDRLTLNLDPFQTRQAETKKKSADEAVDLPVGRITHYTASSPMRAPDKPFGIDIGAIGMSAVRRLRKDAPISDFSRRGVEIVDIDRPQW